MFPIIKHQTEFCSLVLGSGGVVNAISEQANESRALSGLSTQHEQEGSLKLNTTFYSLLQKLGLEMIALNRPV